MALQKSRKAIKKKPGQSRPKSKEGIFITERRRMPRFHLDLPLDYLAESEDRFGGIATNGSRKGLLVYLPEAVFVGTLLKIEILYTEGLKLNSIRATARVVWSDLGPKVKEGIYRYGLEFLSFQEGDLHKLRKLLEEKAQNSLAKRKG
jgi:PilZ domain